MIAFEDETKSVKTLNSWDEWQALVLLPWPCVLQKGMDAQVCRGLESDCSGLGGLDVAAWDYDWTSAKMDGGKDFLVL